MLGMATRNCYVCVMALPYPTRCSCMMDGWRRRKASIGLWPPCMILNISDYLLQRGDWPLCDRLRNDYKEGVYSWNYYTCLIVYIFWTCFKAELTDLCQVTVYVVVPTPVPVVQGKCYYQSGVDWRKHSIPDRNPIPNPIPNISPNLTVSVMLSLTHVQRTINYRT